MKKAVTELSGKWLDSETWSLILSAYEKSNLSVKDFCATQGVSVASYYRWQKRIQSEKETDSRLFSPVKIQPKSVDLVVVELPGGVILRFGELPPVDYLRQLSTQFSGF